MKNRPNTSDSSDSSYRPLRIWIAVLLVALMPVARSFSDWFPEIPLVWMVGAFVPALLGILIALWWLMLSRATWPEKLTGLIGLVVTLAVTIGLLDKTMLGPPIIYVTLPTTLAGFAIGLLIMSRNHSFQRTIGALICSVLVAGCSTLLKNDGATGDFGFGLDWRWKPTPEEVFLQSRRTSPADATVRRPTADDLVNPSWPGFRGPLRDGSQRGSTFPQDWNQQPPTELWRISLGPAWSSFAVADSFLFTQEQRGENEAIVCYDALNGNEVWARNIKSRFFDALGGLGPRATPTIHDGSIYALGAEGWLVKLTAADGTIGWQVDLRELTRQPPPMWGYSCSPLVHDGMVIVHAAGPNDLGILAFDTETGERRWSVPADKDSYCSLHLTKFFGAEQLVFLASSGALFLDPKTGQTLLDHPFPTTGYRAVQPAVVDATRLLFTSEYAGTRLIELRPTDRGLTSTEVWTSRGIKPDFNDLVVHKGFAYGFDGAIFTCVDLSDGSRRWRKGRYGKGQVLLLVDSDLLLVIAESGELILLPADSTEHREIFKLQALDGKTWNHPVVVDDRLYLRNANQAVCYLLPQN